MLCHEPVSVGVEDSLRPRLLDGRRAFRAENALDHVQPRVRRHCDQQHASASLPAQGGEMVAHKRTGVGWYRERLTRRGLRGAAEQGAADLEGQESVAATRFMDAHQ